jgi:hypothetical protein
MGHALQLVAPVAASVAEPLGQRAQSAAAASPAWAR